MMTPTATKDSTFFKPVISLVAVHEIFKDLGFLYQTVLISLHKINIF